MFLLLAERKSDAKVDQTGKGVDADLAIQADMGLLELSNVPEDSRVLESKSEARYCQDDSYQKVSESSGADLPRNIDLHIVFIVCAF